MAKVGMSNGSEYDLISKDSPRQLVKLSIFSGIFISSLRKTNRKTTIAISNFCQNLPRKLVAINIIHPIMFWLNTLSRTLPRKHIIGLWVGNIFIDAQLTPFWWWCSLIYWGYGYKSWVILIWPIDISSCLWVVSWWTGELRKKLTWCTGSFVNPDNPYRHLIWGRWTNFLLFFIQRKPTVIWQEPELYTHGIFH